MSQPDQDIRSRLMAARLPAMPQILLKLLEHCQVDGAGMGEMAKLVANDAAVTAKILQVANSAAYNRGGQKPGLMQALGVLGSDMIKTLVIGEAVFQAINGFPGSAQTDLRRFWKHALGTAVLAREIAKAMDYPQPEEAYLAGLLHDVGRLALLAAAPAEYAVNFQAEDDQDLCRAETHTLQMTHPEAGAWVVEQWKLDSFLADAILYHHEPAARVDGAHPLIRQVHLAHELAGLDPTQALAPDVGALCKLPADILLPICQGAAVQVQKAAVYLGIDLSGMDESAAPKAVVPGMVRPDPAQQRLGEEVRNMTLLSELGQTFARQKDLAQLLRVARQNAQITFQLDSSAIFLVHASGQALVGVSVADTQQRLADFAVQLSGGGTLVEALMQQRLAFLGMQGAPQNLTEEQLLRTFGSELLLCAPLVAGGQSLGMLFGGVPARLMADLQRRERFVLAFAGHVATALNMLARSGNDGADLEQRVAAIRQEHRDDSRRVVHEVNNPLAIIKNYLEVLDDKLMRQEPVQAEIGVLHEEIDRISHIMGEFVGSAPAATGTADINQVVNKLVRLFKESKFLPPNVELQVRLPPQPCEIDGAADTLKQILVNLVKNAVEVLAKGGRIDIINNGQVQRNGRVYYALCVSDNGPGIPSEHRSKLFSPVQSSKPGSNRGIGLSIVHGLVKKLGGTIACVSTSTRGTMFEICLPVPAAQVQPALASSLQDLV